jgi:hypothetical protein
MKKIELGDLGTIHLFGIEFEQEEGITCDKDGNEVKYTIEGRGKGTYKRVSDSKVLTKPEVFKKLWVEGEEIISPSLTPTTKIDKDDIRVVEDKEFDIMKRACERKQYIIQTNSPQIKKLLEEGKSIIFPAVVGTGFKVWKGVVQKWITKNGDEAFALFCCRGDIDRAFSDFKDKPITLTIPAIPKENAKNIRKLFKSI